VSKKKPEKLIFKVRLLFICKNATFDLCEKRRRKTEEEKTENRNRNRVVSQSSKEEVVASKWFKGILNYIKRQKKKKRNENR